MANLKTINDFTPEIKAKIPEYIEKYTKGVFDGGRYNDFDKEKAEALVNWTYEQCTYKKPVVLVAENPFEAQIFFNYIVANKELFGLMIYINYCLLNGIELPKIEGIKIDENKLDSQLDSRLYSQLYSQLDSLGKMNSYGLFITDCFYGGVIAWWKFMKDEFNLTAEINATLDSWNELYLNGNIYTAIFSELVCVVSKYPKKIHRNENNDLHNINGSSVEWGNSTNITEWNGFYINGRNIPEKHFKSISDKSFKMEDFINESNEEYKSTCIALMQEKYGDEYLVDFFREYLKETDSFVDKKDQRYLTGTTNGMNIGVYTLFKGNINETNIAYVRCYCPSTDRMFFLGVDSSHTNAKDAIASLYRIPSKLKKHIKSISRQGERYSTILTEKGNDVLSSMSKYEIEDVSGIDGESYFKLIKYEF